MENIKKHINKIVIGIVLVFIITFVYNMMNKKDDPDIQEIDVIEEDIDSVEVIQILDKLETIKIDETFFDEDLGYEGSNLISFSDLEDFSESELEERPIGKLNPFLNSTVQENQNSGTEEVSTGE